MKITKSGMIEPCCDSSKDWIKYFYFHGNTIETSIHLNYDDFYTMPIYFCPFCGVKTEVAK